MIHELIPFIHFGTIALAVGINSIGVGIGQGLTSVAALNAINEQPAAHMTIVRAAVLGMALIETSAIMGTFVSVILLVDNRVPLSSFADLATIGIALAICISGFVLGIVSSFPAQAACYAIARQPFFEQRITGFMIMTQALVQTPIISGLVVALFIRNQAMTITTLHDSLRLIASGLCIGLGSIGPSIGLGTFARAACQGLGINRHAYNKLLSFTLISEAIIETPVIFALVISITLLFLAPSPDTADFTARGCALFSAGLCAGLGTIGPGISSGKTAAAACKQIALNPESHSVLSRISLFAQGLIETSTIYAILIAFMLILF